MIPIPATALANAVLMGAQRFARATRKTYTRRQVTTKQRALLALLSDGDGLGLEDLKGAFPQEWEAVSRAHPERQPNVNERAFFQNLADMAARLNAYLVAGYDDGPTRARMLSELGGRFVGFAYSYESCEISPLAEEDLEVLRSQVRPVEGNQHAPRRRQRTAAPLASNTESAVATEPPVPPATTDTDPQAPPAEVEPHPSAAPPEPVSRVSPAEAPPTLLVQPDPIDVLVNPVSGRWQLRLNGRALEVDPRLGLLCVDGRLRAWPGGSLPEDPLALSEDDVDILRDAAR